MLAHDDTYLYIFFDEGSAFGYDPGNQFIFFDTDLNPLTGNTADFWWWNSSTGGVGAEHTMYGWALWHYPDTSWGGDSVNSSSSNAGNHLKNSMPQGRRDHQVHNDEPTFRSESQA